jgi:hypothetical protein
MYAIHSNVLAAHSFLVGSIADWRVQIQMIGREVCPALFISWEIRTQFLKSLERMRDASGELGMAASKLAAAPAFDECLNWFSQERRHGTVDLQKLITHAHLVASTFFDELSSRSMFVLNASNSALLSRSEAPFGPAVHDAFPSARAGLTEAGRCSALGQHTASVTLLMRT